MESPRTVSSNRHAEGLLGEAVVVHEVEIRDVSTTSRGEDEVSVPFRSVPFRSVSTRGSGGSGRQQLNPFLLEAHLTAHHREEDTLVHLEQKVGIPLELADVRKVEDNEVRDLPDLEQPLKSSS